MSLIWTAKNYSENESRNNMDTDGAMKTAPYRKIPYLILNKYG
ncbi:MAG: hypothetical protein ABSF24_07510 [Candidatus Bathyarchaeia archaeon]